MADHDQHSDHSSGNAWEGESGDDDVWDDADNVAYDRAIAEKEWSRMNDTFGNTGYREGIEEGKEGTLQQGFNQGWSEGVQYGHELGRLRGLISPLLEYLKSSPSSTASSANHSTNSLSSKIQDKEAWLQKATVLVKELIELDISKVFDKAFFDDIHRETSTSSATGSGCCGGNGDSTKDPCCKNADDTNASSEDKACPSSQGESGPCLSGGHGSDKDKDKEWSSRPERVISEFRSRVRDLLKDVGLESLL